MPSINDSALGLYVLDDAGYPVRERDTIAWGEWFEAATKEGRRRLGDDTIGPYRVSTIFLGADHGFGEGPPVLWETMIFGVPKTGIFTGKLYRYRKELGQRRYISKADALAGHADALRYVESLPRPTPPESLPPAATN